MTNTKSRFLLLALILLLLFLWSKQDHFSIFSQPKPSAELLDYNRVVSNSKLRPLIVSTDEKINTEVLTKHIRQ